MVDPAGCIREINAVTLATADMAAAVAFYEALGFATRYGGADADFTSFHAGRGYLNLQLDARYEAPAHVWGRVILWVDDVDAMHTRIVANGYATQMQPSDAPWGERYFHVRDPDGHEISVARLLDD